jgi:hypothetical protein
MREPATPNVRGARKTATLAHPMLRVSRVSLFDVFSACAMACLLGCSGERDGLGAGGSAGNGGAGASGGAGAGGTSAGGVSGGGNSGSGGTLGGAGNGGQGGTAAGAGGASAGEGGSNAGASGGGADGGSGGSAGGVNQAPNVVFVTSAAYSPAEIGGTIGADAKCAALAEAAGLSGTFVAWLSDATTSAGERLGTARGFANTRRQPFADEPTELLNAQQVFFPVRYDENGDPVAGRVATGSTRSGEAADTCLDWTSSDSDQVLIAGDPSAGAILWTDDFYTASCDQEYHLYCFQIDHQFALYPTLIQGRTVFISSVPFTLGPQGRGAADALCAAEASAGELAGTFIALLGTATESPLARLILPGRIWVKPDGMAVADGIGQVTSGLLATPIDMRADGTYEAGVLVFGAADLDADVPLDCGGWTDPVSTPESAVLGVAGYTDSRWHSAQVGTCNASARVVCAQR